MISFIIPAYNEQSLIAETIAAIRSAAEPTGHSFEIIVADDASTDETAAIATAAGAKVIAVAHRQIAATRNAGARAACGEWFIFVDADTRVSAGAVRSAVDAMQRGAAGGGCRIAFDGWVPWHARLLLPPMLLLYQFAGIASGSFLFCTRRVFQQTGGFDESLFASEEVWFSRAISKHGPFIFLREQVITSGRKLRAYSASELYGTLLRMGLKGTRGAQQREGLDIWYGERRRDPAAAEGVDDDAPLS